LLLYALGPSVVQFISPRNLVSWIIVFMSVLVGFVLAFSTAFGGDVTALRTPFQARP
jgi:hypothetical protein